MIAPAAYCHQCRRETATVLSELSSGHIGNLCAVCRTGRKGKPYVSRSEFEQFVNSPSPIRGEGVHHDQTQ